MACSARAASQRLFRAGLHAFEAEDTLRPVQALAGVVRHVDVHRADAAALAAGDAFRLVAGDAQQREVAHRL